MKLHGKVAIITGAGRELGKAIALAMAAEGARLSVMSRTHGELEEVAETIQDLGGECLIFAGDVSVEDQVSRMVQESRDHFHKVDILVNNAAVVGPARFLGDADPSEWNRTLDINLTGAYRCARQVLPHMVRRGCGKIINIASGLGQMPFSRFCAYAVSKAGIIQLTRSLSEELKPHNIQVNAIDPGVMDTAMQEQIRSMGPEPLGDELHRHFVAYKEQQGLRDPGAVAPLAVFLASADADHLTGHFAGLEDYKDLGWKP